MGFACAGFVTVGKVAGGGARHQIKENYTEKDACVFKPLSTGLEDHQARTLVLLKAKPWQTG